MLISLTDIQSYRDISSNITPERRVNTYIDEAEQMDIKPVLNQCGKDFFYDITYQAGLSPVPAEIELLLDGGTYTDSEGDTISFKGLKAAICHYAYARIVKNQKLNVTALGVVGKVSQHSQPIEGKDRDSHVQEARSVGLAYLNEVITFLCENEEDYPLWEGGSTNKKGSFNITSIHSQYEKPKYDRFGDQIR